jgi:hypothetical protein
MTPEEVFTSYALKIVGSRRINGLVMADGIQNKDKISFNHLCCYFFMQDVRVHVIGWILICYLIVDIVQIDWEALRKGIFMENQILYI